MYMTLSLHPRNPVISRRPRLLSPSSHVHLLALEVAPQAPAHLRVRVYEKGQTVVISPHIIPSMNCTTLMLGRCVEALRKHLKDAEY